jgi:hypothetical protein
MLVAMVLSTIPMLGELVEEGQVDLGDGGRASSSTALTSSSNRTVTRFRGAPRPG